MMIRRIAYLTPAVLCDIVFLYFALNPGSTKEEWFGSFLIRSWMLIGSLVLSIPIVPYVAWKFVKQEKPIFWTIALIITSIPIILTVFGNM